MGKEGFWNDVENANKVNRRMKAISSKLDKYQHLMSRCEDLETLIEMADEENDESLVPEVQSEFASLEKDIEALKLEALLKGAGLGKPALPHVYPLLRKDGLFRKGDRLSGRRRSRHKERYLRG